MPRRSLKSKLKDFNEGASDVVEPYIITQAQPETELGKSSMRALQSDYLVDYPSSPDTGVTRGVSDGAIMTEIEKLGNDLDQTLTKAAKELKIPLTALMMRIYSSIDLTAFFKTILRARAILIQEERDRLMNEMSDKAKAGELDLVTFKVLTQRVMFLDRDMRTMDREILGNGKVNAQRPARGKGEVIDLPTTQVITTTLSDG